MEPEETTCPIARYLRGSPSRDASASPAPSAEIDDANRKFDDADLNHDGD